MKTNRSETIAELAIALAKAQGQIKSAPRDSVAGGKNFSYKYATLESIWESCREPLSKNGLSIVQIPANNNEGFSLETILIHTSGEWVSGTMFLPIIPGRMTELQAIGSAISYARRYMLASMVGVTTGDDDDSQLASALIPAAKPNEVPFNGTPWRPTFDEFIVKVQEVFQGWSEQDIKDQLKILGYSGFNSTRAEQMLQDLENHETDINSAQSVAGDQTSDELAAQIAEDTQH